MLTNVDLNVRKLLAVLHTHNTLLFALCKSTVLCAILRCAGLTQFTTKSQEQIFNEF